MGDNREPKPAPPQATQQAASPQQSVKGSAPTVPAERITPLQSVLDVGEQIYGSSHVFEVAAPWNLGPGAATVDIVVTENPAFNVEDSPRVLAEANGGMAHAAVDQQLQSSIRVRFSPVADGEYPSRFFAADMTLQLRWPDGASERRTVHLRGRARRLEDRPEGIADKTDATKTPIASAAPASADHGFKESDRTALTHAYNAAFIEAGAIARSQSLGVSVVKDEAGSYVPPPVKRSLWWDIAEGAIMLGTGLVAGSIAKLLAERAVAAIAGSEIKPVADAVAAGMKDGMKTGAKAAVHKLSSDNSYDTSQDKRIAFFEMQQDALNSLVTTNEHVVNDRNAELTPLLGSQPDVAIRVMSAITDVLAGQHQAARDDQKKSTAAAWVGFRSRMALGAEALPTPEHETVTDLAKARPAHPGTNMSSLKGLLDLDVDIEHGAPYVASARVNGVAKSLAQELLGKPLATYRIPVRIVVSRNEPEPTIITRDEAGRVRVSGNIGRLATFSNDPSIRGEAQAELAARRLAEEILAQPFVPRTVTVDSDDTQKDS